MAKIELYKDSSYGGRSLMTEESIENLKNYDFNDQASSCKVRAGIWMLYKDANFQGEVSILPQGNYDSPDTMGLPNDSLSSLRKFPEVSGPTILLFKDSNFRGRMVVLTGAESNFKGIDFNDVVSSVIVLNGTWELFKDTGFKGTSWTLSDNGGEQKNGYYPTPSPFENDSISSAKPE